MIEGLLNAGNANIPVMRRRVCHVYYRAK